MKKSNLLLKRIKQLCIIFVIGSLPMGEDKNGE